MSGLDTGTAARAVARTAGLQAALLVLSLVGSWSVVAGAVRFFSLPGAPTVLWWPAAALMVAAVVRLPRRYWATMVLGLAAAVLIVMIPQAGWAMAVSFAVVNVAEVLVAAHLLVGRGSERRLRTAREALRFSLTLIVAMAAGALLLAARSLLAGEGSDWAAPVDAYLSTHVIGLLVFAPLLLPSDSRWSRRLWQYVEFTAVLAATIGIGTWAFISTVAPGRAFALLLPVVWAGARVGAARTVVVTAVAAGLAAYGTSRGRGPFAAIVNDSSRTGQTQLFLAALAATALLLVLISRHREYLAAQARAGEETLRRAIRDSLVPMYSILLDPEHLGEIRDANTALTSMLGYGRGELEGEFCGILGARDFADRRALLDAYLTQLRDGVIGSYREESQFIKANGELLWVETNVSSVSPVTGPPFALVQVHDLTQRQQNKQMLEQMALYDSLTGVANRTLLFRRLTEELTAVVGSDRSVGLLYLDLDDFKTINDTFGHAAGDVVLIEAARRFSAAVRPGDTVARLGGDEFAVLCASVLSLVDLQRIADRIRLDVSEPLILPGGEEIAVTVSVGMAVADGLEDPDHLMRVADASMYEDKYATRGKGA